MSGLSGAGYRLRPRDVDKEAANTAQIIWSMRLVGDFALEGLNKQVDQGLEVGFCYIKNSESEQKKKDFYLGISFCNRETVSNRMGQGKGLCQSLG